MRWGSLYTVTVLGCTGTPTAVPPTPEEVDPADVVPATRWVGTAGLGGRTELKLADAGDFDGDGEVEVIFNASNQTAWIIDGATPSGPAFERVESEMIEEDRFPLSSNIRSLGDLDADGIDDFNAFGLFIGLSPLPAVLTADDAVAYPYNASAIDLNSDGQADLSLQLGPLSEPGEPDIPGCPPPELAARRRLPIANGWDEAILASTGVSDREVLFTLTWENAAQDGLCMESGSRYWTVPREANGTDPTTADYTGDGITDFSATLHGEDLDVADRGIYIVPGPGQPQEPNDPPDIRGAPIRIEIPDDEHLWYTTSGDFDGDGFTDLLYSFTGQLRVYRGPFEPGIVPLDSADAVWRGDPGESPEFYRRVRVHDIDRDGQDDLLMWDDEDEDGGVNAGKIYVVWSAGIGSGTRDDPL